MKVLLTHPGTQHSHKLAIELYNQEKLFKFCTRFSIPEKFDFFKIISKNYLLKMGNRSINIPSNKLRTFPLLEIYYQYLVRSSSPSYKIQYEMNEMFQKAIPDYLLQLSDFIVGFDTSSHVLVQRAKKFQKKFILDRTIGHPASQSQIFSLLHELYPEWRINNLIKDKDDIKYEQFEHDQADFIVVPSNFVKKTLTDNNVDSSKIFLNPFGTNLEYFGNAHIDRITNKNKLNFLFFGTISARKGIPTLLQAWEKLKPSKANLILAGFGKIPDKIKLPNNCFFIGPVAANDRSNLFSKADVFVFPSFFEGFAQVQIEAAASGLPIISTSNAGGDEIVAHNQNGILVEPGNVDDLSSAIQFFIDNPDLIYDMGNISRRKALENFSWGDYGKRWSDILNSIQLNLKTEDLKSF